MRIPKWSHRPPVPDASSPCACRAEASARHRATRPPASDCRSQQWIPALEQQAEAPSQPQQQQPPEALAEQHSTSSMILLICWKAVTAFVGYPTPTAGPAPKTFDRELSKLRGQITGTTRRRSLAARTKKSSYSPDFRHI